MKNLLRSFFRMEFIYKPNLHVNIKFLYLIFSLTVLGIILLNLTREKSRLQQYDQMVSVAQKMNAVYQQIHQLRTEKNIVINPLTDNNNTGFIGQEFSFITTTLGNPEAKQIALNPDFAALILKWISKFNFSAGDKIVIHASASFPALTIMSIIVCEELQMEPVIFSSVGASSWGANIPGFTYLDIENHLFKSGLINHRSSFVTPGGTNDNGSSFWAGGINMIRQSVKNNGYKLQIPSSLENSISRKWELISLADPVMFINIGGNHAALGRGNCALNIPVGLITEPLECSAEGLEGLISRCSKVHIPVIHMLSTKKIAYDSGISILSGKFKEAGKADVYYYKKINIIVALISFVTIFILLALYYRKISYVNPHDTSTIFTRRK